MDTAEKRQHLEFIRNIIARMNTNSFRLKGMAITIVSALTAICASAQNVIFVFLGIPPALLFWLYFPVILFLVIMGFVLKYNYLAF